ncbi:hypothetical protein N9D67_02675 [Gammaproteobacteria bacterium]|nr:hypothetical protein [Gammaproteobacteria bacterium]
MEEFFTNLHIGWWFLSQTLIIIVCFISIDRYAYHRAVLFGNVLDQLNKRLASLEDKVADAKEDLMSEIVSIPDCNAPERDTIGEDY